MDEHDGLETIVKLIVPTSVKMESVRTRSGNTLFTTESVDPAPVNPEGQDLLAPPDDESFVLRIISKAEGVEGERHLKRIKMGNVIVETVEAAGPK